MNRKAFDHAVRAAGAVLGENEVLVIGSQAIHATISRNLPPEAERSIEADVAALNDPDERKADLIDGSIGEASMFHETFGYYAQGVSQTTAVLPEGWRDRLVRYESPSTNGVVAWCLEIHDLWLSKAVAMREKDIDFCRALAERRLVKGDTLRQRLVDLAGIAEAQRAQIARFIDSVSGS
ncbi:MAG TPA: DUF6036 family nucleotidyltransferase [Gemmatimonadota bacterium]|nr:DUF6036 family nucleotidyltransferase [Gemmatimonadota bacterium]